MTVTSTGCKLTIRPVERADLLEIYRIERASFPQPWPYSVMERHLEAAAFFVAIDENREDRLAGYVIADDPGFGVGHVKDLAVHPDRRGEGIGRTLLERALATLDTLGTRRTRLEVRESNGPAQSLYRSCGFRDARIIAGYYEDGEDALVMIRSVD